jgi:hypothetical protein
VNYRLAHCSRDSDCGIDGVCAFDGTCICPFWRGGALCDIPTNVSGTCTGLSGVSHCRRPDYVRTYLGSQKAEHSEKKGSVTEKAECSAAGILVVGKPVCVPTHSLAVILGNCMHVRRCRSTM